METADEMRRRLENHYEGFFFRSFGKLSDKRIDASVLGLIYPFEIYPPDDWPDGRKAIDNLEMDGVGTLMFGVYNHCLVTGDNGFLSKMWPMTKRVATFLVQNLGSNGLMSPSYDF